MSEGTLLREIRRLQRISMQTVTYSLGCSSGPMPAQARFFLSFGFPF
jgi:hypothetical protein